MVLKKALYACFSRIVHNDAFRSCPPCSSQHIVVVEIKLSASTVPRSIRGCWQPQIIPYDSQDEADWLLDDLRGNLRIEIDRREVASLKFPPIGNSDLA
jgi:hypothetical protein